MRRALLAAVLLAGAITALWSAPAPTAGAAPTSPCKVLGLASTLAGGASSVEMQQAAARGCTVEIVDNAGWAAKTATQFGQYRALVLGDPNCSGGASQMQAATDTIAKWGPRVTGNVIINGTDPVVHPPGGNELTQRGIDFAIDDPANTGMYISLSCYFHGTAPNTPVDVLDAFAPDAFTVKGVGCFNDSHIVATHAALNGLTDADLSNWGCSVHEAFDSWDQTNFLVLAIAENAGGEFNAPDGTVGTPYILARGQDLRPLSDITLTQSQSTRQVGGNHTMIATVVDDEAEATAAAVAPVNGKEVTFTILSGPGSPRTGTATTGSAGDGQAAFTFTSNTPGPTRVEASFVDDAAATQKSNVLTVVWEKVLTGGTTRAPAYRLAGGDGGVFGLGAKFLGTAGEGFSAAILSPSGVELPSGIAAVAATPSGLGYYLGGGDGAVYAFNAPFRGSVYGLPLAGQIVDMAVTPSGNGYYLLGDDGGVFALGGARYFGAVTDFPHNGTAVAIAVAPDGNGYWIVMSDGGVYAFGSAKFPGSLFGLPRNGEIVGIAANPVGSGVWVATTDGGVYALKAPFFGSVGHIALERPIVGIAPVKTGGGYWLASDEGGVFALGSAPFRGSIANGTTPIPGPGCCSALNAPIVDIAS